MLTVEYYSLLSTEFNTDCCTTAMNMPIATPSSTQPGPDSITFTLPNSGQTTAMATPKTRLPRPSSTVTDSTSTTGLPSNHSSAVAGAVAGVVAGLVVCIAVTVLLIIVYFIFKRRRNINTKKSKGDHQLELENYTTTSAYEDTAEGKASPEHLEEYNTGKGPDNKLTQCHHSAVDGPHHNAVNEDSRASPSTGQSTLHAPPAAYHGIKTSTDTYSMPFSPHTDTYTVPENRTQKGDRATIELEGGMSEKSDATAGAVYAVVDKKRKVKHRTMTATEEREAELEKSAATAGVVYAVVDKKKKAPPPLPPPYQPGD